MKVHLGGLIGMICVLAGCQQSVPMLRVEVDRWGEPTSAQAAMQRFAVIHAPADPARVDWLRRKVDGALDAYLSRHRYEPLPPQPATTDSHDDLDLLYRAGVMARQAMIAQGFRWEADDADLLVSVDYCVGRRVFHVPVNIARKQAQPGQSIRAYDAVVHAHAVAVYVYDRRRIDQPIWHGSAVHLGPESGLARIGKTLFEQVVAEFPYPTDHGAVRLVMMPEVR